MDSLFAGRAGLAGPLLTGQGLRDPGALLREVPQASTGLTHALYRVTANLASSRPVVAIIDDLHWADPESIRFASYLGSRTTEIGCSLIIATAEADFADEDPLRADNARVEQLTQLAEGSVRELIMRRAGACTARCAATCHWLTGGNPMLLNELIAAAEESGQSLERDSAAEILAGAPGRTRRRILGRFATLSEQAILVARASAVFGSTVDRARIMATTALDHDAMGSAIDELESAGIFDPRRTLDYTYPLVRAAVYSLIPREERARMHSRAAAALRDSNGEPIGIASQLMRSRPEGQPWVVEELTRAADRARETGELDRAVLYLGRALIEPPAPDEEIGVLVELGRTQLAAGATESALSALRRATVLADEPTPAALAVSLGRALYLNGEARDAADVLNRAMATGARPVAKARSSKRAGSPQPSWTRTCSRGAERVARTNGLEADGAAPPLLAIVACHLVRIGESRKRAVSMAETALARDRDTADPATWAPALLALCWAGEAMRALGVAAELRGRRSVQNSLRALAALHLAQAHANHLIGRLDHAEQEARRAAALVDRGNVSDYVDCSVTRHAGILLDQGKIEQAEAALADETGAPYPLGSLVQAQNMMLRGRIHAARRDHQKALAITVEAGRQVVASGIDNPSICNWRAQAAIAAAASGESDRARRLASEELALALRFGADPAIGIALTAAGRVAGGAEGLELLLDGEALLSDSDARLEHARTLVYLGSALRLNGSQKKAQTTLRSALDLADSLGDDATAARARSELGLTGKRPRSPAASGPEALTSAERRVTELAVDGLTNREIAEELYVTRKTVEWHLRNAYRKLEINPGPSSPRRSAVAPPPACSGRDRGRRARLRRARRRGAEVSAGDDPIAAGLLGLVEGLVGAAEETLGGLLPVPEHEPGRGGLSARSRGAQALDQVARVAEVAAGQRERELLAAVAGEHVGSSQLVAPGGRELLEHPVAGLMAVHVVVVLEPIEVDDPDAERSRLALRSGELAIERLVPGAAVGQAGQFVGARDLGKRRHQVSALACDRRRLPRDSAHPADQGVDEHRPEDEGPDRRHPTRRGGVRVVGDQQPGVGERDRRQVEDRHAAREEDDGIEPDPDVEERVEAARIVAVIAGSADCDHAERDQCIERAERPARRSEQADAGGGEAERDVGPQRRVVERVGVREQQRERADRPADAEQQRRHQPREPGRLGEPVPIRHFEGCLSLPLQHDRASVTPPAAAV